MREPLKCLTMASYAMQYLCVMPLEVMAASLTLEFWGTHIPRVVVVAVFLITIVAINLCSVKTFGETEFFLSIFKVAAMIGFMFVPLIMLSFPIPF
jgi:amino acid transporter